MRHGSSGSPTGSSHCLTTGWTAGGRVRHSTASRTGRPQIFSGTGRTAPLCDHYDLVLLTSDRCHGNSSNPRKELVTRLRKRKCELCETGTTVAVHQVTSLKAPGKPGPGQPPWAALMARMHRKTLIVCAQCHDLIHADPAAHAA